MYIKFVIFFSPYIIIIISISGVLKKVKKTVRRRCLYARTRTRCRRFTRGTRTTRYGIMTRLKRLLVLLSGIICDGGGRRGGGGGGRITTRIKNYKKLFSYSPRFTAGSAPYDSAGRSRGSTTTYEKYAENVRSKSTGTNAITADLHTVTFQIINRRIPPPPRISEFSKRDPKSVS